MNTAVFSFYYQRDRPGLKNSAEALDKQRGSPAEATTEVTRLKKMLMHVPCFSAGSEKEGKAWDVTGSCAFSEDALKCLLSPTRRWCGQGATMSYLVPL